MAQAYGVCPVCRKVIALDPVDVPGEPAELLIHLKEHAAPPPAAPSPAHEGPTTPPPLESFPPAPSAPKVTIPRASPPRGRKPHA